LDVLIGIFGFIGGRAMIDDGKKFVKLVNVLLSLGHVLPPYLVDAGPAAAVASLTPLIPAGRAVDSAKRRAQAASCWISQDSPVGVFLLVK
jgi:hypothetical protein